MKSLYEVTAIKPRRVKTITGWVTAPDGYVEWSGFQVASSEDQAMELARYYMPPSARNLPTRVTWIRNE